MTTRTLQRVIESIPASDGAGVKLLRSIGNSAWARVDPFLMLDHFSTDNADDYIAGFPAHPHRGFETVTYMLDGHMRHEDHLGHTGDLKGGGVQWMTAGRGIIHSEMPQQEAGRMRGFQLWINLPGEGKNETRRLSRHPGRRDSGRHAANGVRVKVIAGTLNVDGATTPGPIQGVTTDPLYFDVELPAGVTFTHALTPGYHAFVYPFEGSVDVGPATARRHLKTHSAGVLSDGDNLELTGGAQGGRVILLAGRPLLEPIVQYGPFVMNTREEIEQAVRDYQAGKLTQEAA